MTDYRKNGGAVGGGLPTAAAAGEVPIADGAGTAYTAAPLGLYGTLAARPAAGVAYVGRSYFATNVSPAGALYVCLDGGGGYAWATVFLGSDGDVAGTATIADGSDGVVKTSAAVSGLLAATTTAGMRTAVGAAYAVTASKTTTYTAVPGDVIPCDATGGAFTVNLPAASGVVQSISIKKTDASINAVTIDGNASETIDGATTRLLSTQYEAVTLWSNGTNWMVF